MWSQAPGWVTWFMHQGMRVGDLEPEIPLTMTVMTVPTRGYACALLAAGCVTAQIRQRAGIAEHIERLRALPDGTKVTHRPGGRWDEQRFGKFMGFKKEGSTEYIFVELDKTRKKQPAETRLVPLDIADAVQILADQDAGQSVWGGSQRVMAPTPFALGVVGPSQLAHLSTGTSGHCVLVGEKWAISQDLEAVEFAIKTPVGLSEGALQEVVGARHLCAAGQSSRARVVSSRVSPRGTTPTARVAVFDGTSGFLRWRTALAGSHWILVLDRTEPRFEEAIELQTELYARRGDLATSFLQEPVPAGIEVVTFARGG